MYPGAWADEILDKEISQIALSSRYEIQRDSLLFNKAVQIIKSNLSKELIISFEKVTHLFILYYYDNRSFNPLYLITWGLLSILFWYGYLKYPLNDLKIEITLFIIYHTILAIVFFVILRYQTMFKIVYLPFAGYGLDLLLKKFKKN